MTCGLTFTFGGLKITNEGEVESTDGSTIPGLFAAGELVGGLFYHNYPGGTGLVSGAVLASGGNGRPYVSGKNSHAGRIRFEGRQLSLFTDESIDQNSTRRHALALGSTTLLLPSALRAQAAWPTGPVTFVVGYAAGGSSDINARELAHIMSPVIGQQIIVDNKGGATGSIGLRAVANAKPDGYTLFSPSAPTSSSTRMSRRA